MSIATKQQLTECRYKTKLIQFPGDGGRLTPIILHSENLPCPLAALCNVLLLRGNIELSQGTTEVSQGSLLSLVRSCISNEGKDAIDLLLPCLTQGIDLNPMFTRITDFESTQEAAIFNLLNIPLYHGWLVDPQDKDTASAIGSMPYNSLVQKLLAFVADNLDKILDINTTKTESPSTKTSSAGESTDLIANFLSNNASQLTFHGLSCLQKQIKESDLCVFYRNKHFRTMVKYGGELYLLVSNQQQGSYLDQAAAVWEKLTVNGDKEFMTEDFKKLCRHSWRNERFQQLKKKVQQEEFDSDGVSDSDSDSDNDSDSDIDDDDMFRPWRWRGTNNLLLPGGGVPDYGLQVWEPTGDKVEPKK